MHDALFEHQRAPGDSHLILYVNPLGLDTRRFLRDWPRIPMRGELARILPVEFVAACRERPRSFISDLRYAGPADVKSLRAAIEQAAEA